MTSGGQGVGVVTWNEKLALDVAEAGHEAKKHWRELVYPVVVSAVQTVLAAAVEVKVADWSPGVLQAVAVQAVVALQNPGHMTGPEERSYAAAAAAAEHDLGANTCMHATLLLPSVVETGNSNFQAVNVLTHQLCTQDAVHAQLSYG
jgi:hypothetical protein